VPLGAFGFGVALTLAADGVEGGVGATDEMEAIADDPSVGQRGPDRVAVGLWGIDRDDLDSRAHIGRESSQPAFDDLALAAGEHLDHPPAIEIRDDRRELATAAVMRLIQRQPARRPVPAPSDELVTGERERSVNLLAAGALITSHLGVRAAAAATLEHVGTKPRADPLTRR
jgi:hypothetical protein